LERSTVTDTAGTYHFSGLPPGTYIIRAEGQGFQTEVPMDVYGPTVPLGAAQLFT